VKEQRKIRILVADDHFVVRMGLIAVVNTEPDLEVVAEAADGIQAVEMFEKLNPDLVLMDISLPGMDGYEATRRIRETFQSLPIIGLSAHAMQGEEARAREAGCDAFLTKPIDTKMFRETLRRFLTDVRGSRADR